MLISEDASPSCEDIYSGCWSVKPVHIICVSTYCIVVAAYKRALKGILVCKHMKMFVLPSCLTTTVYLIHGSLLVSSLHGGADVYISQSLYVSCQWCSCNYCRLFFQGVSKSVSNLPSCCKHDSEKGFLIRLLVSVYQLTSVVPSLNNLIFTTNILPV